MNECKPLAVGDWGAYQIEGPGLYYNDELAPYITGRGLHLVHISAQLEPFMSLTD